MNGNYDPVDLVTYNRSTIILLVRIVRSLRAPYRIQDSAILRDSSPANSLYLGNGT